MNKYFLGINLISTLGTGVAMATSNSQIIDEIHANPIVSLLSQSQQSVQQEPIIEQSINMDEVIDKFKGFFSIELNLIDKLIKEKQYERLFSMALLITPNGHIENEEFMKKYPYSRIRTTAPLKALLKTGVIPDDVILKTMKSGTIITQFPDNEESIWYYIYYYKQDPMLNTEAIDTIKGFYQEKLAQEKLAQEKLVQKKLAQEKAAQEKLVQDQYTDIEIQKWKEEYLKNNNNESKKDNEEVEQLIKNLAQERRYEELFTLLITSNRSHQINDLIGRVQLFEIINKIQTPSPINTKFPSIEAYPNSLVLKRAQVIYKLNCATLCDYNDTIDNLKKTIDKTAVNSLQKANQTIKIDKDVFEVIDQGIATAADIHLLFLNKEKISDENFDRISKALESNPIILEAFKKSYEFNKATHEKSLTDDVLKIIKEVNNPLDLSMLLLYKNMSDENFDRISKSLKNNPTALEVFKKSYEFNKATHEKSLTDDVLKIIKEVNNPLDLSMLLLYKNISEEGYTNLKETFKSKPEYIQKIEQKQSSQLKRQSNNQTKTIPPKVKVALDLSGE